MAYRRYMVRGREAKTGTKEPVGPVGGIQRATPKPVPWPTANHVCRITAPGCQDVGRSAPTSLYWHRYSYGVFKVAGR